MLNNKSDYELIDVAWIPSVTGNILPVRDGSASQGMLLLEDLAFLYEAYLERWIFADLGAWNSYFKNVYIPAAIQLQSLLNRFYAHLAPNDVIEFLDGRYVMRDDVQFEDEYFVGLQTIYFVLTRSYPNYFLHKSDLAIYNWRDAQITNIDSLRRMFYNLKLCRKYFYMVLNSFSFETGNVNYTRTNKIGEAGEYTETFSGSFSNKLTGDLVTGYTDKGRWVQVAAYANILIIVANDVDTGAKYKEDTYIQCAEVIKTKEMYKSLTAFISFQIEAEGYAENGTDQQLGDGCFSIPIICQGSAIVGDPDGYVQQWVVPPNRITPGVLRQYALNHGYKIPEYTEDGSKNGKLYVRAFWESIAIYEPIFRSEIDSTGWDWQPPELAQAPANAR